MVKIQINKNFVITIPRSEREYLGLKVGDWIDIEIKKTEKCAADIARDNGETK